MIKGKEFGAKRIAQGVVLWLLFFLSFFSASKSWAVGNIHLGLVEIDPGLQTKIAHYQVIDEDVPDLGGDWITTCSPGIKVEWPVRQHMIKGVWLLNFPHYHKYSERDYNGNNFSTHGDFVFGQGGRLVTLGLGHNQIVSDEPANIGESRRKRRENKLSSNLGINLNNNLRLDLSYDLNTYRYEDNDPDDLNENQFGTVINVRVQPKTEAFISGRHYQSNYKKDNARDSTFWTIGPGIRWDATSKLSGQISGGFSWRDYEKRENVSTWVVTVDLTHQASDFTKLSLGIDKGERDHSVYKYDENGDVNRDINGDPIEYFNNYAFHQVRLSLDHQLTYKVKALSGLTYEHDNYHGITRKDDIYSWRLGLKYQIQEWLVTELGFEQRHRNCTGDEIFIDTDYSNNIYSLSLGLAL